jgi:two-component system, cell cycle response regulator DivK
MSHILLIEDNQANADMMIHILTSAGYQVRHFIRGLEGVKDARQNKPDLILLDFNLPDVDGRTLALSMRKQMGMACPPIVACTARTGVVEKALAKQFGCAAFLPKPFDSHDLLDVVASFIKTRTS